MSLLVTAVELEARKGIARGELRALADGLRAELAPLIAQPPDVPREKALLSRSGGRCTIDGSLLIFDPFDKRHRCPQCGREYAGGLYDRFRLYWYQLWLAERVLHAAVLGVLFADSECINLATTLLDRFAEQYLKYPNADNVLGPSRPFFSTYLESIWLLQLTTALDVLESSIALPELASLGSRVRDRLIRPSASLISSYDEGTSNRQVWNNAALMAAARMLDDRVMFDRALRGRSGLHTHLVSALLSDGSWYEGENYHFFAHRGLWYGSRIASTAGQPLPPNLASRFHEGFAAPFRTVLPDLTFPSRRDSQYAVSVRQPRFAESCELGLASRDDLRLTGMLARLYDDAVPRGDTGRVASSADVERNLPGTGLRRTDLSWRALLFARPTLPALVAQPFHSDLLPAQGVAILRRNEGSLYVSLDYGHSGGGHGHPDRLNLTLMDGTRRWFDDPGTGSYVDPSLHWYRSTLAHNAPIVDGHSQPRVHGDLLAYEDDDRHGWVSAQAELAPGLIVQRTIVTMADYLVDELQWEGVEVHEVALPMHDVDVAADVVKTPTPIAGGNDEEDGFAFLTDTTSVMLPVDRAFELFGGGGRLRGWTFARQGATAWCASAPRAPGRDGTMPMVLLRQSAATGSYLSVWSWSTAIRSVERDGDVLVVLLADGTRQRHRRAVEGWLIETSGQGTRLVELGGRVSRLGESSSSDFHTTPTRPAAPPSTIALPATFELGEPHYRQSEFTWQGAGAPRAVVAVTRPTPGTVQVDVDVPSSQRLFVPLVTENQLDNEPASINGDSVQLYVLAGERAAGLLLVPEVASVGQRPVDGWTNDLTVDAKWRPTSSGYRLEATIHIDGRTPEFSLDVLVNEVVPGRARRRGQLVLSGAVGEFVYLRGDRHDPSRLLRFSLTNA
ncbi:MAG: heparinase II/III family protein [Gemmatimonadaceae bacterium]